MKNIKWYKIGVLVFMVWMINSLAQIKLHGFRPYAIAMITFTIIVCSIGCSSAKPTTNKSKNKVTKMTSGSPQYAFSNNQIVIFENN
jgi:hypothetical protein